MIWRALREEDLPACLSVDPTRVGAELVGHAQAVDAWRVLTRCLSFRPAVIEADPPVAGHRIVAFGASVFVSHAFAEEETANPRPGLNARIIASVVSGRSVVLDNAQLRSANKDGGLDLVVLYPQWRKGILAAGQISEVQATMASAFLNLHMGFRLNRVITESVNQDERVTYLEIAGFFKFVSDFSEFYSRQPNTGWNRDRSLAITTREEAFRVPGAIASMVFQYREPVLQLREADQHLLSAALTGLTDEELARSLNIGLPTVKKRWRSLFEQTSARPDLFPGMNEGGMSDGAEPVRGRQKRQLILTYLRDHPEELRPF